MPPKKRLAPRITIQTTRGTKRRARRPLGEQWQRIESDALEYLHTEQTPDRILLSWLAIFGEELAQKNDEPAYSQFLVVEKAMQHYHDHGNAIDRPLLEQMRDLSRSLRNSGVQ